MWTRMSQDAQRWTLIAALGVVLGLAGWAFGAGARPAPVPAAASAPAPCFVTGAGNQLCGDAALAYCKLHYLDYEARDSASLHQCEASFPGLRAEMHR